MNEFISLGTDIIIGNPPYQDDAVGEQKTYNGPIYNLYLDCAYSISDVVEMIHPARFLSNAGSTPKAWNKKMLEDRHIGICEFWNKSVRLFDETEIKGVLGTRRLIKALLVCSRLIRSLTPLCSLSARTRRLSR